MFYAFGNWKEVEGGAYDYIGTYRTLEEAQNTILAFDWIQNPRLSTWVHIAQVTDDGLRIVSMLNIPGTEQAKDNEYGWVEVL